MTDGRTHLAHKAEHAVDLETGAIVEVTVQDANAGDTTTMKRTVIGAAQQVEDAVGRSPRELVGDKGYHSNDRWEDLHVIGLRSYVSEPKRGRRRWRGKAAARAAGYGNRRRIHGARGRRLLRRRGEYLERTFAHVDDTGGMRRTHLRGHLNILKRVLVHVSGFNLGLLMRRLLGVGTPRGLQGRAAAVIALLVTLWRTMATIVTGRSPRPVFS
jgi:transposase